MEDYRSKSCRDGEMMQIERFNNGGEGPTSTHDLRCYSTSHASTVHPSMVVKFKKTTKSESTTSRSWTLNDPEFQRKKRVASYKVYSVEGKMKGSFNKSFRWIKDTCTQFVYGYGWRR